MRTQPILALALVAGLAARATSQCSAFANTPPGTNLNLGDDTQRVVALPFAFTFQGIAYTSLTIASNGFVALGAQSGQTDWSPTALEALNGVPRIMPLWWDLNPGAGGGVYFEASATQCSVAWKGVPEFGSATTFANFELILTATGTITFYYDPSNATVATRGITPAQLVGITAGGGAAANPRNWNTDLVGAGVTIAAATATEEFSNNLGATLFDLSNLSGGSGTTISFFPLDPQHNSFQAFLSPSNLSTCAAGPITPLASAPTAYGTGCPGSADSSMYEFFSNNAGTRAFDLANTSIQFVRAGSDYVAVPGPGFDAGYTSGVVLPQGDDTYLTQSVGAMGTFQLGTNTAVGSVVVASNGYIAIPAVSANSLTPSTTGFHTGGPRIAALWEDLVCNTTTQLCYWENSNPAFCRATWVNVPEYGSGGSNTFQVTLAATGDVTLSYLNCTAGIGHTPFVGIVGSNRATDPGPLDLATSGAVNVIVRTLTSGLQPMAQTASGPAQFGQPFSLTSTVPANNLGLGAWLIGVTNPAVPLSAVLGGLAVPGCSLYSGGEIEQDLPFAFAPGATSFALSFPAVPYNPAFGGMVVYTQALAALPPFLTQVVSSNGLTFTVGL